MCRTHTPNRILTLIPHLNFTLAEGKKAAWGQSKEGGGCSEDFCAAGPRRWRRPNELLPDRDQSENRGRTHTYTPSCKILVLAPSLPPWLLLPFQLVAFPVAITVAVAVVIIIICQPFICPRRS